MTDQSPEQPWYVTLFERDYYDYIAPGGTRSRISPEAYELRTQTEVDFIAAAFGLPPGAPILDLCCGWGRHTVRMAQRGYRMSGLDLSPYHLDLARQAAAEAGVEIDFIQGDMRSIPRPDATFDAVTNLWTSFGYFEDEENQRVLEEVSRVLKPGGRFLLDVINRDNLISDFREKDWSEESEDALIIERHRWDAVQGRLHVEWTLIDREGNRRVHRHDERIYTLQELELLLALAGMPVRAAFGAYDGRPISLAERRLIVLAEKV